jgi:hypothetical protein
MTSTKGGINAITGIVDLFYVIKVYNFHRLSVSLVFA